MATAEAPHPAPRPTGFGEFIKKMMVQLFHQKELEKLAKQRMADQKDRYEYESEENRDEEKRNKARRDRGKKYHKAKSADVKNAEAEVARLRRAEEVKRQLSLILQDEGKRPEGSNYVLNLIAGDTNIQSAVVDLIESSPSAREAVYLFITKGAELQGSAKELIKVTQRLSYEANKAGNLPILQPVFEAIGERVETLLWDEFQMSRRVARHSGTEGPASAYELLAQDSGIVMKQAEIDDLRQSVEGAHGRFDEDATKIRWSAAAKKLVTVPRDSVPIKADWVTSSAIQHDERLIEGLVTPIDEVWGEIERLEATGKGLDVDDLRKFDRRLKEEADKVFPKDVPPGSEDYDRKVQAIRAHTEKKLDQLAEIYKKRLLEQNPKVREGIVDPKEFLEQVVLNPGRLGLLFDHNPQMKELFLGLKSENRKFRDKVFLQIHGAVLGDQRNSSNDNFGLYQRADFTTFTDMLRIKLSQFKVAETGQELGYAWSDYYNNLSNAIRQSRDIDFWASQPAADISNFNKSLGMFQNEYIRHAMSIPAVCAAFRAYEVTLRSIQASNDGYIPPSFIEYDVGRKGSYWDLQSKNMLKRMIQSGVIPDLVRDEHTQFHVLDKDGHTFKMDYDSPLKTEDLDPAEYAMYMTLAKGIGLVTQRYLEIFANAKVPGSVHPDAATIGFHSIPYEGVARSLNYMNTVFHKWKMGSYKYFHLMNMLIPDKKIHVSEENSREAAEAYLAYRDGTFEEKYGSEAKRFIDLTNFSGISSAIGKDTLWRQWDATIGWSDRMRENLGGGTLLALAGRCAKEAVKDFLVVNQYREKYRQDIIALNSQPGRNLNLPVSGPGFDKLWEENGVPKYNNLIEKEWDRLQGKDPKKGVVHNKLYHDTDHLIKAYTKAFKARVWVQLAMRNPLGVAHNVKLDVPLVGGTPLKDKRKITLHQLLVQDILGISPEDTKYGEEYGRSGKSKTPTQEQEKYMAAALTLEGDLAAVRERAINAKDSPYTRDLAAADFNIIKDPERKKMALEYWKRVRQVVLGTDSFEEAAHLYDEMGLNVVNGDEYAWNYEKIHHFLSEEKGHEGFLFRQDKSLNTYDKTTGRLIKGVGKEIKSPDGQFIHTPFMLRKLADMNPEWIIGTDDMAMGKMDWLNLGARNWLRRGGDTAAHDEGAKGFVDYIVHGLKPKPDRHKLPELLEKIRDAYSGDMIEAGWTVAARLAYMTDRLYAWDTKRLGSIAQLDVWNTRRNVDAWLANTRREFWDALEHQDVIPPHAHFYFYDIPEKSDIHTLRKLCHADNYDVIKEALFMVGAIAIAITLWRGLTAKSEEEEGGGGGEGHH